jgi:allene oxide cyclase-like protein
MPPLRPLSRIRAPPMAALSSASYLEETMGKKLILGAMLAALLVVVGASLAFAGGESRHKADGKVRTLHVVLRDTEETDLDLGASGPSVGDRFSVFGSVFRNDERAGMGGYECVTMLFRPGADPAGQPEALTDQCVATLSLPEGQITVQGLVDRTGPVPVTLAITGGTGAYRTAHGELETSGPNEQGEEPLTLRLILNDH